MTSLKIYFLKFCSEQDFLFLLVFTIEMYIYCSMYQEPLYTFMYLSNQPSMWRQCNAKKIMHHCSNPLTVENLDRVFSLKSEATTGLALLLAGSPQTDSYVTSWQQKQWLFTLIGYITPRHFIGFTSDLLAIGYCLLITLVQCHRLATDRERLFCHKIGVQR